VSLEVEGEPCDISTLVDRSAYRVVQEALTNVAKHAPTASTTVTISYRADETELAVVDDGAGTVPGNGRSDGRGIIGMRERVTSLGGSFHAGHDRPRGFTIRARLPLNAGVA